jgi:hypothetical protein
MASSLEGIACMSMQGFEGRSSAPLRDSKTQGGAIEELPPKTQVK